MRYVIALLLAPILTVPLTAQISSHAVVTGSDLYFNVQECATTRSVDGRLTIAYSRESQNYVRWSTDNGATWSSEVHTNTEVNANSAQTVLTDSSGTLILGSGFNVSYYSQRSTDQGQTWVNKNYIVPSPPGYNYFISLAYDAGNVLHGVSACWEGSYVDQYTPVNIFLNTSVTNGVSYTGATRITNEFVYRQWNYYPTLCAGLDNDLFVLYTHYDTTWSNGKLMLLHYDGSAWLPAVRVTTAGKYTWAAYDMGVLSDGTLTIAYNEGDSPSGGRRLAVREYDPVTRSFSAVTYPLSDTLTPTEISLGVYRNDAVAITFSRWDMGASYYRGTYLLRSVDGFAVPIRISASDTAKMANLRSSTYNRFCRDSADLVWIERYGATSSWHIRHAVLDVATDVLPVQLVSLTAVCQTRNRASSRPVVELQWTTAMELNCRGFFIERRQVTAAGAGGPEASWKRMGFVQGSGNSSIPRSYTFTDDSPAAGLSAYRLLSVDIDGSISHSGSVEAVVDPPVAYRLLEAHPNPFNPATTITYELPIASRITIIVFNALGQEVARLVDGERPAGSGSVTWTPHGASGIYFCRLEAAALAGPPMRHTEVRKLVLTR